MTHEEGGKYLQIGDYRVRVNDDGKGWTGQGVHAHGFPRIAHRVVVGVIAHHDHMHRRVFGRSMAWRFDAFVEINGKRYSLLRSERRRPTNSDVYDMASIAFDKHFKKEG